VALGPTGRLQRDSSLSSQTIVIQPPRTKSQQPVNIRFRVCGIPLAVQCDQRLLRAVSEAVEQFRGSEPGRYRLKVAVIPSPWGARHLECIRWEEREMLLHIAAARREQVAAAIGCLIAASLVENRGLLLHGAFLLLEGLAHIFVGKPGAGKSTIARNASKGECVHDDKVAVRHIDGRWMAFGVPLLDNARKVGRSAEAPLGGVYLIEKSDRLRKVPVSHKAAMMEMPAHVVLPFSDPASRGDVFETLFSLIEGALLHKVLFSKDADVTSVI
jgi:hypothetical protein